MRRRRRRTITNNCLIIRSSPSSILILLICYVCCLAAVLPETMTTSHDDRIADRIQRTTEERTSADDDRTKLMSVTTEWNHLFYGLKENTDKGMESTDIIKDSAHDEKDEVTTYSEKWDFSATPGDGMSSHWKNILEAHVFPKVSTTHNQKTIGDKDVPNESDRGQKEPSILGRLSDGRAVGTRMRHRTRRSEVSIDDGTLEDLFNDALVFSERALRSKLRKSKVAVRGRVADDQINFDADQEAVEAAEEDSLEKRDANEVAISKTVIKDMEDTVFGQALDYIKNNGLEPSKNTHENSNSSLNTLNATGNNSLNASVAVTPHEGNTSDSEGNKTTVHNGENTTSSGLLPVENNTTVLEKTTGGPTTKEEAGKKVIGANELEKKEQEKEEKDEKEDRTEVGKKQRTKMTFNDWMKMKHKQIIKNESRKESEKGSSKRKEEQRKGAKSGEKKAEKKSAKLKKGAKKKTKKLKKSGKALVKSRKKKSLPETENKTYVKLANRGPL